MSPPPNMADATGQGPAGTSRRLRRDRSNAVPTPVDDQPTSSSSPTPAEQAAATKGKENTQDQELAARFNRLRSTPAPGGGPAKRPVVKVPPPPVLSTSTSSRAPSQSAAASDNEGDSDSEDSVTPNQSLSLTPSTSSLMPATSPQINLADLISTIHANVDSPSPATLSALSKAVSAIPSSTHPALLPANHPRRTPLHSAIMRKNPQAVSALLANPAIVHTWANMADHAGITPLVLCLRSKRTFNLDTLRTLLVAGASVFAPATAFAPGEAASSAPTKSKKAAAAAEEAAFTSLDVLAWAMQHIPVDGTTGADVFDRIVADARKHGVLDQVTNEGYGALHLAVNLGSPGHVKSLLDVGAMDPSSSRNRKWPVAHFAACNNQVSALHLLLDAGCPANLPAHDGQTPLHAAAAAGHLPAIDHLIAHGADATVRDNNGWMPITWALDALCKRGRGRGRARKPITSAGGSSEGELDQDDSDDQEDDVLEAFESLWMHLHASLSKTNEAQVALAKVVANKTKQGETLVDMALVHGRVEVAVWLMSVQGARSERLAGVGDMDVLGAAMNLLADQVAGARAEVRRIKELANEKDQELGQDADETQCIVIDSDGDEEQDFDKVMATPSARTKAVGCKPKAETTLTAINLSPIRVQPAAAAAAQHMLNDTERMDVDTDLPPVPRLRPILPAAPGRYPAPAIRVAMPEDAARVLVAALDSHLGDVAGLDATTPLGPLDPDAYLSGDHVCSDAVARVQAMVRELATSAGVTSGLDAVNPALDRALDVAQAHPMVDVEPALAVMQVAVGKHVAMVEQGTKVIVDMQAADSDVRAAANEAARDLAEFTRLQEAREYLGALRAEDRWMGKQLAMLARRGELLRRVQRAAGKQAGVVEGITSGAQWADKELDKMAMAVEEKTRAVEVRVKELAGVRERVRMAVGALEVEWQAKIAGRAGVPQEEAGNAQAHHESDDEGHELRMSASVPQQPTVPWLLEFCSLFLHMERMLARESGKDATGTKKSSKESGVVGGASATNDDERHPPAQVLSRMLQWYLEAKSGEAQSQHKAMSTCLRALQAHAETLTLIRRATEWTTGAMLAQVRSGLNTLQGHAGNLKQAIPSTYEELHARLVFNERLCKRNCKDMQMDLRHVLETKNKAFEARRMGDLQRCDDQVRHLHEALEKEEKRLVAIEELMQRAFAAAHRYLDQERVEQLQQEYLELGVLLKFNVPPSGVTGTGATGAGVRSSKKRPRPGTSSPAPSAASNATTLGGTSESSTAGSSTIRGTLVSSLSMLMGGRTKYDPQDEDDDEDIRSDDGFGSFLMSPPPHKVRRVSGSATTPRQAYSIASAAANGYSRERQLKKEEEQEEQAAAAAQQQPGVLRRALTAPVGVVKSIFSFSWLPTWSLSTDSSAQQPLEGGRGPTEDDTIPDAEYRSRLRALTQTHYRRNTMRPTSASANSADTSTFSSLAGSTADNTTLNSALLDLGNESVVSGTTSGEHGRQASRSYREQQATDADELSFLGGDDSF